MREQRFTLLELGLANVLDLAAKPTANHRSHLRLIADLTCAQWAYLDTGEMHRRWPRAKVLPWTASAAEGDLAGCRSMARHCLKRA